MKRNHIFLLIAALFLVSIIFSIPRNQNLNNGILTASAVLGAFGAIATLYVALLLYNRFKIDHNIIDAQREKAMELLATLRNKRFAIRIKGRGTLLLSLSNIHEAERREEFEKFADRFSSLNLILLFNNSYLKSIAELIEMSHNFDLPIEIANAFLNIQPFGKFPIKTNKSIQYGRVGPASNSKIKSLKSEVFEDDNLSKWFLILNKGLSDLKLTEMTLRIFISQWADLMNTVESWVKSAAPRAADSVGTS